MEHVEFVDLLPAFALGCLDPEDERKVNNHLSACPGCQAEYLAFLETTANLAVAAPQIAPPARLKRSLLEQVRPAAPKLRWGERLQAWWRGLSPAWGFAGLALVVVLIASNVLLWAQVQNMGRKQAVADEFRVIQMAGTQVQPAASGIMVVPVDSMAGTLTVDGLTMLPQENQYQLWLVKDGKRISGGVFSVDNKGYAALIVKAPLPLSAYTSFGITIEPAGGSPGPTGKKVLGGST